MSERLFDDPTLPPPGRRTGAGSSSILPYLLKSLATRPQAGAVPSLATRPQAPTVQTASASLQRPGPAAAHDGDVPS